MTENHLPLPELQNNSSGPSKKKSKEFFSLSSPNARKWIIIILGIILMTALFIVSIIPVQYDMPVDSVASESVYAYKDWEDIEKTEQLRHEAESKVGKVYYDVPEAADRIRNKINILFAKMDQVRLFAESIDAESGNSTRDFTSEEISSARQYLEVTPDDENTEPKVSAEFSDEQILCIMHSNEEQLNAFKKYLLSLFPESEPYLLKQDMIASFIEEATGAENTEENNPVPSEIINILPVIGPTVLNACIEPGNVEDTDTFEKRIQEARDAVEPYIIRQGEEIVRKGEIVTVEQHQILEKMGLLTDGTRVDPTIYVGGALLVISILLAAVFLIFIINPNVGMDTSRILLAAITIVLDFCFCILARIFNVYTAPILMCALVLTSMVSLRSGIVMNIVLSILFASLTAGGSESFSQQMIIIMVTNILGGTVASMIMKGTSSRTRALICIPAVISIHAIICLSFNMMTSSNLTTSVEDIGYLSISTVLSVLLFIALQPIFESIFNLPTSTKLLELSNPNHPLLKRLMMEAPGTYHHSLMVANLAEASAEAIGANTLLARVGGYYHDIGKLKRPLFFSENQAGEENAHDHTDPQVSAAILTAHPVDGVSIAKSYHLPKAIQQIIASHHGNSPVMYFYGKALKQAEGKEVDINNFRYNANLPSTKECAIIMLCDTVEAAVRSMKNPSPDEIDAFISKLFRGKIDDGQLSDSPLTLQDIERIRKTCVMQMTGVYHERVSYPDLPNTATVAKSGPSVNQDKQVTAAVKPVPEVIKNESSSSINSSSPINTQAKSQVQTSSATSVSAPSVPVRPAVVPPAEPVPATPVIPPVVSVTGVSKETVNVPVKTSALPPSEVKYVAPEIDKPIPTVEIPKPFTSPVNLDDLLKKPVDKTEIPKVSSVVDAKAGEISNSPESKD